MTWEQLEAESAKAFAAFCAFRDLAACARSVDSAYRRYSKRKTRAPGTWGEWSREFQWVDRAQAYDGHCDEIKRQARERAIAQLETRRLDFEIAEQERYEARCLDLDKLLDKLLKLPLVDTYGARGKKKGLNLLGFARILASRLELSARTVNGVREEEDQAAAKDAKEAGAGEVRKRIELVLIKTEAPEAPPAGAS